MTEAAPYMDICEQLSRDLDEARQMLHVYRAQRDAAEDRCKAFDKAIQRFRLAFRRYARREHSDAHVLQPDVDALMSTLDSASKLGEKP